MRKWLSLVILLSVVVLSACNTVSDFQPVSDDLRYLLESGDSYSLLSTTAENSSDVTLENYLNSPSGCGVWAYNPHESHHNPGRVNAETAVTCRVNVPYLYLQGNLYRYNWYWGYQLVDRDFFSNSFRRIIRVFVNSNCISTRYGVTANGRVTDNDNITYTGNAYNYQDVSCR
jgi:hypothetical protein